MSRAFKEERSGRRLGLACRILVVEGVHWPRRHYIECIDVSYVVVGVLDSMYVCCVELLYCVIVVEGVYWPRCYYDVD